MNQRGFTQHHFQQKISTTLHKKNGAGFTLLEVMVAIFVITVGVIGALSALQRATTLTFTTSSKLEATYLAQEAIEIVRNIRDANWLEIHKGLKPEELWDDNIGQGEWEADHDDIGLTSFQNRYLKIDGSFYNYDSGNNTKFKRKISILKDTDILEVQVQVTWEERGKDFQVTAQENLYNWK